MFRRYFEVPGTSRSLRFSFTQTNIMQFYEDSIHTRVAWQTLLHKRDVVGQWDTIKDDHRWWYIR